MRVDTHAKSCIQNYANKRPQVMIECDPGSQVVRPGTDFAAG
jgi:hypothetical protein